jgi:flavin reductase (DIM6/NTAB) family NADH-FMN oxidoreductase RutF
MKHTFKPGTMIYPVPAVMISCGKTEDEFNIFTASWVGTICSDPPMCYVSIRPERHSYSIIKKNLEFVIHLTNQEMCFAADWCGVRSGKEYNKFKEMKLTPVKTEIIDSVFIEEAPLSIECRVKEIIPLGSHDMFIAEVVNVLADDRYMDKTTGAFELSKAKLIAYNHGGYFKLGEQIGKFGWSVQKKKRK